MYLYLRKILKRILDILLSIILLLVLSPLAFWIATKLKLEGGSVIFKHKRVGLKGKKFYCYKFRSMIEGAETKLEDLLSNNPALEAEWKNNFKIKNDPRVTNFGLFLRKTSLDEIPQLWNVIKGDMSLVGPRAITQEELFKYGVNSSKYEKMRPGITGLWQISGRSNIEYSKRIYLDVWYVENWTLKQDFKILINTISVVMTNKGAY